MRFDQTGGIVVVDRDGTRTLPTLIGIEQVEPGIAALIDAEAGHVDCLV
jgi:hypothetical protein